MDHIALQHAPLDAADAMKKAGAAESGAITLFAGITRAERNGDGRPLLALDYEAYGEMALRQMQQLVTEARRRWQISTVVLLHRTGRVDVGEPSVLVVVSTPHRAEAFQACRFLIDQLKAEVPIWKKEVWADGSTSWVPGKKFE